MRTIVPAAQGNRLGGIPCFAFQAPKLTYLRKNEDTVCFFSLVSNFGYVRLSKGFICPEG